jgi:hypothetical protein
MEAKPGHSLPAPVAPPSPPTEAANAPASASAVATVPRFGGLRGGKPRKDGLVPGSTEAAAADRERDRRRKEAERKVAEPAPLPSLGLGAAVASPVTTPVAGEVPQPGAAPVSFVPWDAQTLKPLFDQLIPTVEDWHVDHITGLVERAKLPAEIVKEIGKDARWPGPSRKAIEVSAPQVAAKWLNKSGISAENQPELVLGTAIVSIAVSHRQLLLKLKKLLEAREAELTRRINEATNQQHN